MYKLRAQDAKERQHWVNVLRMIAQSYPESSVEREVKMNISFILFIRLLITMNNSDSKSSST